MSTPPQRLAPCISCHSWNADGSKLAICPNDNTIQIYAKSGTGFTLETTLTEHDQVVTGLDWGHKTNRLVSCSQDRNAYVWTNEGGNWKPVLVILRLSRAATHVRWSPNEDKFAVSSGQKLVSVCYFEEDNDWWVSKHIKKHKSTVEKVEWHPTCNSLIATCGSDFRCRIFSAHIREVDGRDVPGNPYGEATKTFGNVLAEFDQCAGWVHSVAWSPSGNQLAFCSHDSLLCVAQIPSGTVTVVKCNSKPFRDLIFVKEDAIIAAGHNCDPRLFKAAGGSWQFVKSLDGGPASGDAAGAGRGGGAGGMRSAAFASFQSKVDRAQDTKVSVNLTTKHQNAISYISPYTKSGPNVTKFCTTGIDGNIIIWDVTV